MTAFRVAQLSNVLRLVELIESLRGRPAELPGFGAFYGKAGVGKSHAAIYALNLFQAYYVELPSCVTQRGFCETVAAEMGIDAPARSTDRLVQQIGGHLADHPRRPLIIDEADHLVRRGIIELVRDIYRLAAPAGASIVLIGEQAMPARLERWERIASRVLRRVKAEAVTLDDVILLAGMVLGDTQIEESALALVHAWASGSARRSSTALYLLRDAAMSEDWQTIGPDNAKAVLNAL